VFVVLSNNDDSTSGSQTAAPAVNTVAVVTAASDIPARARITADMLRVSAIPTDLALTGAYSTSESLAGLTARYPIAQGEQVTTGKVGQELKDDKSLSLVIPAGKRAIAIPVKEQTNVGGLVLPGDIVDVIAIFAGSDTSVDKAVTLLQNVEVLAVAQEKQEPIPPAVDAAQGSTDLAETPSDVEQQPDAGTVTLAVTPDQAQLLALTSEKAKLWLTLRARGDAANVELGATDLSGFGIVPPPEE
jgi:pilus assembly protein CpaB